MNVLIIGSGGREHAIALKIKKSSNISTLFCAPGNPGTERIAKNINLNLVDHIDIKMFCLQNKIQFVIIGPEQPLVDDLADYLRDAGIIVFGPSAKAAQIESSKLFAKKLMKNAGVPTAKYEEFQETQFTDAINFLQNSTFPIVIKADGLASGKGVFICMNLSESEKAVKEIFENKIFGDSGSKIIIEEFLKGDEASIFAITDGENFVCLPAAQDHKRIGNGDTGKNTGGMGAYAPAPIITDELLSEIENKIIDPTLQQLRNSGNKFIGCLYAGLIITSEGPKVIEFNCRFGDPETQVVLPLLEGDLLQLLYSAADGNLNKTAVKYSGGCSVCVVAASAGYPDDYKTGFEISGLELSDEEVIIYHAGTKKADGKIVTNGGRVLGITSVLNSFDLIKAQNKAYEILKKINFNGMNYRKDIGEKAFKYLN